MSDYYDRQGNPVTRDEWVSTYTDSAKRVASTDLGELGEVSTVWLGIDHGWGRGEPVIFETLVFGGALDQEMVRYSTEAGAVAGHKDMVRRIEEENEAFLALASRPDVRGAMAALLEHEINGDTFDRLTKQMGETA